MINNIALAGCGNVGTALLEILEAKKTALREKYGFEYKVVLVCDLMKGTVMDPEGLDLTLLLKSLHEKHSFQGLPQAEGAFGELLDRSGATLLAECTPTNLKTGEPGLGHLRAALSRGMSATTTNKGPLAVAFDELARLAKECGGKLGYEGVVMSGTPLLDLLKNGIAGCDVIGVEGILNGTTNFILTKMAEGMSYARALAEATALGYAEADPSGDVEGWDAAVKVAILAKIIYGLDVPVNEIDRQGITEITQEQVLAAKERGSVIKLIAGIDDASGEPRLYVKPQELPLSNPLASISGATNAVTIKTDHLGDVTLTGPGAGRAETGQALLGDMLRICSR